MSVDPQSRALTLQLYNLHITPMIIEIETNIFDGKISFKENRWTK